MSKYKSYIAGNGKTYNQMDISTGKEVVSWNNKETKLANYSFIQMRLSKMLGKTLTIIDASIIDSKQNKATKDLLKGVFINEYCELTELMVSSDIYLTREFTNEDLKEMKEVSEDGALGLK